VAVDTKHGLKERAPANCLAFHKGSPIATRPQRSSKAPIGKPVTWDGQQRDLECNKGLLLGLWARWDLLLRTGEGANRAAIDRFGRGR
jgi:hypothetical protein